MATIVTCGMLLMAIYMAVVYLLYPYETPTHGGKRETAEHEPTASISDSDIMGKSTFHVNTELRRIRQAKEDAARKKAIAKGEMTEDGKEIAQEIRPEDCETVQERVWKQVPSEELDSMFDEPDESTEPHAEGATINDIDLAFDNLGRKDLSEEEVRQTVKVLKELEGTEFLDAVEQQFSEVGVRIDELIDRIAARQETEVIIPESFEDFKLSDFL